MRQRKDGLAVETVEAKAGFNRTTGYRFEGDPRPPSEKRKGRGSRCPGPLGGLFERVARASGRNVGCTSIDLGDGPHSHADLAGEIGEANRSRRTGGRRLRRFGRAPGGTLNPALGLPQAPRARAQGLVYGERRGGHDRPIASPH